MTLLENGTSYTELEELATFCVLGVRFWDATTDAQIRRGLRVRAWPEAALRPVVAASRTRSDIYAFHRLPGLGAVERPLATGSISAACRTRSCTRLHWAPCPAPSRTRWPPTPPT